MNLEFRKNFLKLLKDSINLRRVSSSNIKEIVVSYLQYRCKVPYSKILKIASKIDDTRDLLLLNVFNDKEWFDFVMDIIVNWGPGHLFNGAFSGAIDDYYDIKGYGVATTKRMKHFLKQVEDLWYEDKVVQTTDYKEILLEYISFMNKDIVPIVFNLDKDQYIHYVLVKKEYAKKFISQVSKYDIDRKFNPEWFTPNKVLPYLVKKGVKL